MKRQRWDLPERIRIRRAVSEDTPAIESDITEWLHWKTPREASIKRAVGNGELLVATNRENAVIGFIHTVMYEDIIDGGQSLSLRASTSTRNSATRALAQGC